MGLTISRPLGDEDFDFNDDNAIIEWMEKHGFEFTGSGAELWEGGNRDVEFDGPTAQTEDDFGNNSLIDEIRRDLNMPKLKLYQSEFWKRSDDL